MITPYVNPYRMGGYEGCGPDWTGAYAKCGCRAVARPRASGPTLGLAGVLDELAPGPKLALGVLLLVGGVVIFQAVEAGRR